MTCKNCLHYEACKGTYYEIHEFGNFDEEGYASSKCDHFKDKSKNIELPCKVGDTVFQIMINPVTDRKNIKKSKITEIRISEETIIILDGEYRLSFSDFGYWWFLDGYEAKKALKE